MSAHNQQLPVSEAYAAGSHCPYHAPHGEKCGTLIAGVRINWRRKDGPCGREDHEECGRFLSMMTQWHQPRSRQRGTCPVQQPE